MVLALFLVNTPPPLFILLMVFIISLMVPAVGQPVSGHMVQRKKFVGYITETRSDIIGYRESLGKSHIRTRQGQLLLCS